MHDTLHVLRIKGRATAGELAAVLGRDPAGVEEELRELAATGAAVERTSGRRPGWLLTAAGRDSAADQLRGTLDDASREQLAASYETFLACNDAVKQVCAAWQSATTDDERFDLLDRLHEVQERVAPALEKAGGAAARFDRYRNRLATALETVPEDPRYLVSPVVDSFHTVWFECHEDFLLSLGRSRSEEGSF